MNKLIIFATMLLLSRQLSALETIVMIYDSTRGVLTSVFADINQDKSAICLEDLKGVTTIIRAIQKLTNGTATTKSTLLSVFEIIAVMAGGYTDCKDIANGFNGMLTKFNTIAYVAANDPSSFITKLTLMFFTEITTINYAIAKVKEYYAAANYYGIGLQIGDTGASFFLKLFP
jgi:hypothetical protein